MVVAINKIDKASPAQVEAVKSQLARHNLVPEEWGGQTIVMPISAKTGQGVDELLDVLVLQSQVMDLKANVTVPARGYILESKFEKGRGPVATVICQHGVLKVGDYFIAGEATGRVSSLVYLPMVKGYKKSDLGTCASCRIFRLLIRGIF